MIALLCLFLTVFVSPFKSKHRLEAENAALRHQLSVLRRKVRGRVQLTNGDRLFFVQLYQWFPSVLKAITIIRPETLIRWHRAGFRRYWRWKSRSLGGRPQIDADLRALIRRMSVDNPLWGAPRIHGELLKLGFEVAQPSIAAGYAIDTHESECSCLGDSNGAAIAHFNLTASGSKSQVSPSTFFAAERSSFCCTGGGTG